MDWKRPVKKQDIVNRPETSQTTEIRVLGLSPGIYECLQRDGIETVEHLSTMSGEDLLKVPGIGIKSGAEISEKLAAYLNNCPQLEQLQLIEVLGISRRAYNCLKRAGIDTIAQIAVMSDDDLLAIQYLGVNSLTEIREKLTAYLANHPLPTPPQFLESPSSELEQFPPQEVCPPELAEFQEIEVLGLSIRTYNCLRRAKIKTVEHLTAMSDDDLLAVHNVGVNALTEIRQKLAAYLASHPLPEQPQFSESSPPELPESQRVTQFDSVEEDKTPVTTLKRHQGLITELLNYHTRDKTSIAALNLPISVHNALISVGIETIGHLALISDKEIVKVCGLNEKHVDEIDAKLATYFAENLPSAESLTVTSKPRLASDEEVCITNLSAMVARWLAILTQRELRVIRLRYGLESDKVLTLEQVGEQLGVTRERIRQIEAKALRKLERHLKHYKTRPLGALANHIFKKAGGVLNEARLMNILNEESEIGEIAPIGAMKLVFKARGDITWLKKSQVWVISNELVASDEVINVQAHIFELIEQNLVPIPISDLLNLFKQSEFYKSREETLSDEFILACLRSHTALVEDEHGNIGLERWTRRRLDEIILALCEIGKPAHFTAIAEQTNRLLPPDQQTTSHNIHAQMQRLPDIFVRVGLGIYGLKEWDLYDDGNLANAAYRVLRGAGRPLHIDVITKEVLKTWYVQPGSVHAAIENDERFTRVGSGVYCLREQIKGEASTLPKADFGDLFGERLAHLQAEIDRQQGPSELDTQAEVDKIRKLGTDFLT